jgi:putative ABC transport system ATP-binding protein
MTAPTPILELRSVRKEYGPPSRRSVALRDVSLQLPAGVWLALTGPSGAGKTTLLNLLAGLDHPTSGTIQVLGQNLSTLSADARTDFRRRSVGFVFQFFNLLPTMTAWDNVALPLVAERLPRREITARTAAMLEAVGVAHLGARRPAELSGGEQQRVAVARALVMRPRLLLADEPTGNLDRAAGAAILGLLRDTVDRSGLSIVMVTHSTTAAAAANAVRTLEDGRILDAGGGAQCQVAS